MKTRKYKAILTAYEMHLPKQAEKTAKWMILQGNSMLKELKKMSDGKHSGFCTRFKARLMK